MTQMQTRFRAAPDQQDRNQGPLARLQALHRPQLLIRAARFGLAEYNRNRDLKRLMKVLTPPSPAKAMDALLAAEAEAEQNRTTGAAAYSVARHVELLIALMGESRLLPDRAT